MTDNPLNPITKLRDAAYRIARTTGLTPRHFALLPAEADSPAHVKLLLTFGDEDVPKIEKVEVDAGLREQMAQADSEARQRKADEARAGLIELEKQLREGGGFLD